MAQLLLSTFPYTEADLGSGLSGGGRGIHRLLLCDVGSRLLALSGRLLAVGWRLVLALLAFAELHIAALGSHGGVGGLFLRDVCGRLELLLLRLLGGIGSLVGTSLALAELDVVGAVRVAIVLIRLDVLVLPVSFMQTCT